MDQLLSTISQINIWIEGLVAALVTAYALTKGGPAARGAGIVNALGWLAGSFANLGLKPIELHLIATCTQDALVAAGFLYFAARYNSLWLSLGVIAQGTQLGLDFIYVSQGAELARLNHFLFGSVLNGLTYVLQVSVLGCAVVERRRLALAGAVRV